MALSEYYLGMRHSFMPEVQAPVVTTEVILKQGEPVLLSELRLDNVGTPDFAALAERSSDTLLVEELHGFAAYQEAGGVFSEGLYKTIMDGVIELQKPDVRENSNFSTGIEKQIKGFEDRHNRPFLGTVLPPEQQIFLTEPEKDAYRVFRSSLFIPDEDKPKKAYLDDASLFNEIRIMPGLKPNKLSEQEKSQALREAA